MEHGLKLKHPNVTSFAPQLGTSFQSLDRMKHPPWSRGVDENARE